MSNEPNQPAEDAPPPAPGAGGEPGPGTAGGDPKPHAGGDEPTTAGATAAPGPSRYLVNPADEDADEPRPAATGGGSKRKLLIGTLAVVVLVALAVAAYFVVAEQSTANAGDCVNVGRQDDNNRADVKTLDCDDNQASYKVGKVLDSSDAACPEDGLYTEVSPTASAGDGYKLCLLPNMTEGSCYKPDDGSGFVKTECTGPETIKVTKVIEDSIDVSQCPDSAGMSYPEPKVTYCLAPAEL